MVCNYDTQYYNYNCNIIENATDVSLPSTQPPDQDLANLNGLLNNPNNTVSASQNSQFISNISLLPQQSYLSKNSNPNLNSNLQLNQQKSITDDSNRIIKFFFIVIVIIILLCVVYMIIVESGNKNKNPSYSKRMSDDINL
jgi:hypothetical protein